MAHSLSAKKRIRQNQKQRARNRWRKTRIKDSVKAFHQAVHDGDVARAEQALSEASRTLDKIASTSTIHKNTASRKKSRLAQRLNAMKAKQAAS
jgi:small subunit ribosomal protein S20